jgi:prolyl oligopeptidase
MYQLPSLDKFDFDDPLESGARLFLDLTEFDSEGTASKGSSSFSSDGSYFAYQVQRSGADWATIHIKDTHTLHDLPEVLSRVKHSSMSWLEDNTGFFYQRYNIEDNGTQTHKLKNQKVYFHKLNTTQDQDILIYENPEQPKFVFDTHTTGDGDYLMLTTRKHANGKNLVHIAEITNFTDTKKVEFKPLISEFMGSFHLIKNVGTTFYFKTNFNAPNKKLIAIDINHPAHENWRDIIPE